MRQSGRSLRGRAGVASATAAALLLVLPPLSESAAAKPLGPIEVRSDETGYASWILPTKERNRYEWLALQVRTRDGMLGGTVYEFVAIKGRCRSGGGSGFGCSGAGRVHPFTSDQFRMEPDLSSALLDIKVKGKTYRARWEGHQIAPGVYTDSEGCFDPGGDEGYGEGGGLWRHADARANFAGKKLAPAEHEHALTFLARGAMVTQCEKSAPRMTKRAGDTIYVTWSPRY